jgi:hypothetical protein
LKQVKIGQILEPKSVIGKVCWGNYRVINIEIPWEVDLDAIWNKFRGKFENVNGMAATGSRKIVKIDGSYFIYSIWYES